MTVAVQSDLVPDLMAEEEARIADELYSLHQTTLDNYAEVRSSWLLNVHFAMGNQWVRVLPRNFTIVPAGDIPKGHVRETVNLIRPRVRSYVSTACSRPVLWTAEPGSDDLRDEIAARKTAGILDLQARLWKMRQKEIRAVKWACWTGTGYLQTYYDEDAGEQDPVQGFRLDAPSPFDILPDPAANGEEDCAWMFRTHLLNAKRAQLLWPEFEKDLVPDRSYDLDPTTAAMLDAAQGQFVGQMSRDSNRPKDRIVMLEYWEVPNRQFPQGRRAVLAGKRLVEYHDYPARKLPVRPIYYEIVPGRYLGQSMVGGIIQTQKTFNRRLSAGLESLNYCSHPKLLVPRKAKLVDGAWTVEAGEKVHYDYPYKPEVIEPPGLPSHFFRVLEMQEAHLDSQTSQPESARGERVPGMRSGRGIALMQEKAVQAMQDTVVSLADALTDVGQYTMEHWQARVPEPVALKYLGQDGSVEVGMFYASDVRTDVRVNAEDIEPQSAEIKASNVRNDVQQGILTPTEAKRHLGYLTTRERTYKARHEGAARAELAWIMAGRNPPVYPWQDQEIHFDVHSLDFAGQDFHTWPQAAQRAAWEHMSATDAQMRQAPQAEGAPGAAPGPTTPTDPGVDVNEENALRRAIGM